ncbi:MAG: flavodoxin domain-containing protein [Micrococcales bacterium]|nr:flavodoxin domain-containing protein [Micrococcales bacterium]
MTTAIVYASKHGTTGDIAQLLATELGEDTALFDLTEGPASLDGYDTIVLGTAIYAGQPVKAMRQFAEGFDPSGQQLALFVCGMEQGQDTRAKELATAFPQALHDQAKAAVFFAGRFQFDKLNKAERFIIRRVAKTKTDVDQVDPEAIASFAAKVRA